jgi:tetratricopeptide (TPR) repeat protein
MADSNAGGNRKNKTKEPGATPKGKKQEKPNNSAASPENRNKAIQAIREGRYDAARTLIRAAIKATDSTSVKHSWRIVESELEFSSKEYAKSGLIAIRIVILTPESEQVGAAYFRAGRAYEKMGRVAKAIEMFEACAAHRTTGELTKKKADKRIEVLKATSGKK